MDGWINVTRSNLECSLLLHAPKKQQLMLIYRYRTITCNCWFYIIINYTTPLANTLHHCLHIILCLSPSCWPCLSHTSEPGVQARCTFLWCRLLHHRTTNGNWPCLSHSSEPGVQARCAFDVDFCL